MPMWDLTPPSPHPTPTRHAADHPTEAARENLHALWFTHSSINSGIRTFSDYLFQLSGSMHEKSNRFSEFERTHRKNINWSTSMVKFHLPWVEGTGVSGFRSMRKTTLESLTPPPPPSFWPIIRTDRTWKIPIRVVGLGFFPFIPVVLFFKKFFPPRHPRWWRPGGGGGGGGSGGVGVHCSVSRGRDNEHDARNAGARQSLLNTLAHPRNRNLFFLVLDFIQPYA